MNKKLPAPPPIHDDFDFPVNPKALVSPVNVLRCEHCAGGGDEDCPYCGGDGFREVER